MLFMAEVGSYEAKTRLPELLRRVEGGEHIVITKHGRAIARLIPAHPSAGKDVPGIVAELIEFRRGRSAGVPLKQLIDEGRRF
jgi:prevent-host-death family protein